MKRFSWTSAQGTTVHAWNSDRRLPEQELATWLWTDVPLTTDYVVWFDAGCCLETGWDEAQLHLPAQGSDYFGRSTWIDYSSQDAERLQGRPWYRGVPLERRNGRPGLSFLNRLWGLRTACLREVEGSGERNWNRWAKEQSGGWPVLMGEIARQLNWSRTVYDPYSQGTTDAVPSTNGVQPAIPNRGLNPQRLENR